jgi:uncharacterized protein YydD (DUF2326 family)
MRLIELRANKDSFKTVKFNNKGMSLIVAKKRTDSEKNTYNSVGKSLIVALIHFCLAAKKNPAFEENLKDWIFYLDFEVNGNKFTSSRSTDKQEIIYVNDKPMTLKEFRDFFAKEVFYINSQIQNLSFRSLISRFIRPSRGSYASYNNYIPKEKEYSQLLNTSYLMGLDISYVIKKNDLMNQIDWVRDLKSKIQKDTTIKSFFSVEKDSETDIKIADLEKKISKLQHDIDSFAIAKDYFDVKREADEISRNLHYYKNQYTKIQTAISNIIKSLQVQPDISKKQLEDFYQEANTQLCEMVKKRLDELESFNKKLLTNRIVSLNEEKNKFKQQLLDIDSKINKLSFEEDKRLQYLQSHGALDDYTKMANLLSDYKMELSKLQQFKRLIREYQTKQDETKKDFAEQNILTFKYLDSIKPITQNHLSTFQTLSDQFYYNKVAGITINNNDGNNKLRFNINAKIEDDTGDGINEVKIFCFDWTILKGQYNHCVKFIFHDSRIVSENDPRQVVTMLRVANKECIENNFQYILTINQSTLTAIQAEMSEEEFDKLINKNEVLELNDISDSNKLLGIKIDLDYTNE